MVSLVRGHDPADLRAPPRGRPAVPAELRRAPATRFSSIFSHISVFFSIDNHSHLHSFTITYHYITASRKRQALFALQKPHAWRSAVIISQLAKMASDIFGREWESLSSTKAARRGGMRPLYHNRTKRQALFLPFLLLFRNRHYIIDRSKRQALSQS